MSALAAAMANARALLAFIGVMTVLGADWSIWSRIAMGLGLIVAVALNTAADGHRLALRRTPRPLRFDKAA
ncbi:hypothetical protein [Streptomyces sp. WM6349]|uniref:hypothetical protein n=1 Tax=Streptomyces sp. WM6349 TaxID=1415552 RepID=UPI0006AEAD1A|nr:hypothetical protein [Streptomyces sp. WM6349]KOU17034.1 hypothetical protein ADK49_16985 [Streptomyces sp. WM6349]